MKTKYFLIGFLLLSTFAFASIVQGADASMGIAEDEEYTWTVKKIDLDKYAELYGFENDPEEADYPCWLAGGQGGKWKVRIVSVDEDEVTVYGFDCFVVAYDKWYTVYDEGFYSEPDKLSNAKDSDDVFDDVGSVDYIPVDPEDLGSDVEPGWDFDNFIPTPVADYLDGIDWADDYESDGNVITFDGEDIGAHCDGDDVDIIVTWEYNNKGVLKSQKLMNADGDVVTEIVLGGGAIPGYALPILLGVAAVGTIGLVYITMKKKSA